MGDYCVTVPSLSKNMQIIWALIPIALPFKTNFKLLQVNKFRLSMRGQGQRWTFSSQIGIRNWNTICPFFQCCLLRKSVISGMKMVAFSTSVIFLCSPLRFTAWQRQVFPFFLIFYFLKKHLIFPSEQSFRNSQQWSKTKTGDVAYHPLAKPPSVNVQYFTIKVQLIFFFQPSSEPASPWHSEINFCSSLLSNV